MSSYKQKAINNMISEGYCKDYIDDWIKIYDATGLDKRDLADGDWDADEFIDAYEDGDFDTLFDMI